MIELVTKSMKEMKYILIILEKVRIYILLLSNLILNRNNQLMS